EFFLSINDQDRWKQTDTDAQHLLVERIVKESDRLGAGEIRKVTSGFAVNNAEIEAISSLLSGLSIPALLTSVGYLLKHLSPLLVEYMRNKSSKEITIDAHGKRITIKGGSNFSKELDEV